MEFKKIPIHHYKVISKKTGFDVIRVKKILAHGVTDWYKSIVDNANAKLETVKQDALEVGISPESVVEIEASLSNKDLDEAVIVYKPFVKNALSIGQLPDSIPEGLRIFLSIVDLAARETGESRKNILKVSKAMYDYEE